MRRHALFVGLLVVVAAAWFWILFASQTHVHSDEAIIGLMAKHILEGRYFPFYMYGQPYNAGAAWEAYVAALAFASFGVSAVALKGCVLLLSLLGVILFYRMCLALYDQRTALLATMVFAITPSLLKWHFQVRGYSWYFLSIPVLTLLFLSLEATPDRRWPLFFVFGLVSGLSIFSLEIGIAFNLALWTLLLLRRALSPKNALIGISGFVLGYAPAITFNLTHHFANWAALREKTGGDGVARLIQPETLSQIFMTEMPKFFGADTVLWYYPDKPASGFVFYMIALIAAGVAAWPFVRRPSEIAKAVRAGFERGKEDRDLLMLLLASACFIPYVTALMRVPGYFLAGCFFFAALTGRLLQRCFVCSKTLVRLGGIVILTAVVVTGTAVIIDTARHNQVETLTRCGDRDDFCMTRIPSGDLDRAERHLREGGVTDVWTTVSFLYPLLFEFGETVAVSDTIFGSQLRVYPPTIPWREPRRDRFAVFVIESDSPLLTPLKERFLQATGVTPLITEYGKLAIVEGKAE
jgi:4-amino-4-deoxy-L-arabinose transferase-like glycosyltransferase